MDLVLLGPPVEGAELMQRDDDRPETIRRRLVVYHPEMTTSTNGSEPS
jgi:adenylate kinase family enzyme